MCDNIPMDKDPVTCPYCWWRGKRHPYWQEKKPVKPCPRCGATVSDGWIFKTVDWDKQKPWERIEHVCYFDEREGGCPVCEDEKELNEDPHE